MESENTKLIEELANVMHIIWVDWMRDIFKITTSHNNITCIPNNEYKILKTYTTMGILQVINDDIMCNKYIDNFDKIIDVFIKNNKYDINKDYFAQSGLGFGMLVKSCVIEIHNQWSGWVNHVFRKSTFDEINNCILPDWGVENWTRQINTPYNDLSEKEKQSDRDECPKYIEIFKKYAI